MHVVGQMFVSNNYICFASREEDLCHLIIPLREVNAHKLVRFTFTFMHLADAFIQSDSGYTFFFCQYMFPGNRTHNLCAVNAML